MIITSDSSRFPTLVAQAIWLFSADTQIVPDGDETKIDYKFLFQTFLRQICEGLRDEAAARRVRVVVADEGRLPAVLADPRGLRTVLANLLQNALTYSPDGGEVRLCAVDSTGGVRIAIEDDGPGVDPAEIDRLMRPFEQGENALTRQTEGAGLGLPIVALLCRAMGGAFRLVADPGKGLRAEVLLPSP